VTTDLIIEFDRIIRRDPARRGLIGSADCEALCAGHLADAAAHLAQNAASVVLATGFYVPHGQPPAAETDGPPGAVRLAMALEALGVETLILTDRLCLQAVACAARASGYPESKLLEHPHASPDWIDEFFDRGPGSKLSHLIAIERVGPSHTRESLVAQARTTAAPVERFLSLVPAETRGRCHNMRGRMIDEHSADIHELFEQARRRRPQVRTIGVGDGGNEIGMGAVPWEDLCRRLDTDHGPRIVCRVATDWNIVAGTSNWGAYALAASLHCLRGSAEALRPWGAEHERRVLEAMVANGPAVDGVTGRREATVDGLPFLTYIQPWEGMRRRLGLTET
jgi:hypothetical protein